MHTRVGLKEVKAMQRKLRVKESIEHAGSDRMML
jgi:hypothetical protein